MIAEAVKSAAILAGGYLLGSISFAILITRIWTGKDIRLLGNRNAGAANVSRSVGLLPAALVALLDFAKGAIPVFAGRALGMSDWIGLLGVVAAVIGHSFPLYFRFKGGKGLAAAIGGLLAITPLETALVLPVLALIYLVVTGSPVSGSLVAFLLLTAVHVWKGAPPEHLWSPVVLLGAMALAVLPELRRDGKDPQGSRDRMTDWFFPKFRGPD